jgi:hypothetical protein
MTAIRPLLGGGLPRATPRAVQADQAAHASGNGLATGLVWPTAKMRSAPAPWLAQSCHGDARQSRSSTDHSRTYFSRIPTLLRHLCQLSPRHRGAAASRVSYMISPAHGFLAPGAGWGEYGPNAVLLDALSGLCWFRASNERRLMRAGVEESPHGAMVMGFPVLGARPELNAAGRGWGTGGDRAARDDWPASCSSSCCFSEGG